MMKKCLFFILLAISTLNEGAADSKKGGSDVGNGAGIAEGNFVYAYQNLFEFLEICIRQPMCELDLVELDLLRKIMRSHLTERLTPDQLRFRSSTDDLGFFKINGYQRIAKTGDFIGSPIYINLDFLYQLSSDGRQVPVSLYTAIATLIHEFGHHHGIQDHDYLTRLGNKVARFIENTSPESRFYFRVGPERMEHFILYLLGCAAEQMICSVRLSSHSRGPEMDLSQHIYKAVRLQPKTAKAFRVYNVNWDPAYSLRPSYILKGLRIFRFSFQYTLTASRPGSDDGIEDGIGRVQLIWNEKTGRVVPALTQVSVEH